MKQMSLDDYPEVWRKEENNMKKLHPAEAFDYIVDYLGHDTRIKLISLNVDSTIYFTFKFNGSIIEHAGRIAKIPNDIRLLRAAVDFIICNERKKEEEK